MLFSAMTEISTPTRARFCLFDRRNVLLLCDIAVVLQRFMRECLPEP